MFDKQKSNTSAPESEITIYARIENPAGLKEADYKEEQTQVVHKLPEGGQIRVRKTTVDGKDSYELTLKTKVPSDDPNVRRYDEHNKEIDEIFYNAFVSTGEVMMRKTRYVFVAKSVEVDVVGSEGPRKVQVPDVKYEVDLFHLNDGTYCAWCKIDVEVDAIETFIQHNYPDVTGINLTVKVSHLPFKPAQAFMGGPNVTETQNKLLDDLYTNFFKQPIVHNSPTSMNMKMD